MKEKNICNQIHLIIGYIAIIFENLNIVDPELHLSIAKPMIKNKLKQFLSELKNFKVQKILVLELRKKMIVKLFIHVLY